MLDDLADVTEPDTYRTAALANDTVKNKPEHNRYI